MMTMPKGLTSASGIDALTHALEAYASIMATDYTDGIALKAMKLIFNYLPRAYENGANDPVAEKDGQRFHHGWYGICQRLPGCVPLHGSQAGCFPSPAPRCCQRSADLPRLCALTRRCSAENGHLPAVSVSAYLGPLCECADFLGINGKTDDEKARKPHRCNRRTESKVGIKKTIRDYGVDEKNFLDNAGRNGRTGIR